MPAGKSPGPEPEPEQQSDELFSGTSLFRWANEKLAQRGLPIPAKPKGEDREYAFPDDPNSMSSVELGQLMLKYAGFHGYALRLLGIVDSELTALSAEYRMKVQMRGLDLRKVLGRVAFEAVEAAVLKAYPDLIPLYKRITELQTVKVQLSTHAEIYNRHWTALSREQARRADELRMESGGR